jgi:hypothetical protein
VPRDLRPQTIERNGQCVGLTYASNGEVRCLGDAGGGKENLIRWAISTDQVDRGNDIVDPAGVFIKRFMDNPVILWNHESFNLPIGIGIGAPTQGVMSDGRKAVMLDILFHEVTRESQDIAALVRGGFLRANSIGFIPLSFVDEPADKYEDAYSWLSTVRIFKSWELLEDSVCAIPMNPGALVQNGGEKSFTRAVEIGILSADSPILNRLINVPAIVVSGASATIPVTPPAVTITDVHTAVSQLVPDAHKVAATFDTPPKVTTSPTPYTSKSMHDMSTAMFLLTGEDATAVLGFGETILDGDLAPDGRETEPHITIKYGIRTDNSDVLKALVSGFGPVTVTLGEVSIFESDENRANEVVHIDVIGRELMALNDLINSELSCKGEYSDSYTPHITLAYVKAGRGATYVGPSDLTGRTITFTSLTFSDPDGIETDISLGGTPPQTGTAALTPTNTMTSTKDGSTLAVPDPNAAPAATPTAPATPAPETAPTPALYDDSAFVDGVLAGLQKIVTDAMAATVSSVNEEVKSAAQSAIDILTPGIEEFTALKESLAPTPVAPTPTDPSAPAAPAAAPAAPAAPTATMSWGVMVKIGAQFNAKNRAHIKTAHAAISELMAAAAAYDPSDGECEPDDQECLDEFRAAKIAEQKSLEEKAIADRKALAMAAAQKKFGHLLS